MIFSIIPIFHDPEKYEFVNIPENRICPGVFIAKNQPLLFYKTELVRTM